MNLFFRDFSATSPITSGSQWLAALGGRDTSVRVRRMRRFEVLTVSDANPSTFDATAALDVIAPHAHQAEH